MRRALALLCYAVCACSSSSSSSTSTPDGGADSGGGDGGAGVTVTQVSAGVDHSCALTSDRRVACWGDNSSGAVGAPTPDDCAAASKCSSRPIFVPGVA